MRIVNFEEFCRMPAGTIFAPYTPCVLEERLAIKTDTGKDRDDCFWSHPFNGVMPLEPWLGTDCGVFSIGDTADAEFGIYDGDNNDYRDYDMFLVFDEVDIDRLIEVLMWAKNGCEGEAYET